MLILISLCFSRAGFCWVDVFDEVVCFELTYSLGTGVVTYIRLLSLLRWSCRSSIHE